MSFVRLAGFDLSLLLLQVPGLEDLVDEAACTGPRARWSNKVGWETLLNRAGTTFRKLPDADKNGLTEKKAMALMLAQPSMIKRPVLEVGGKLLVGFKPEIYEAAFGK